jgi:ubiquinone/menaquinone biosynthesis C-methylase UbiE
MMVKEAQSLSVKRAQVEFHNFASLGEPERAMRVYAEENDRRGAVLRNHLRFIGGLSPFLEIGANAGHTSYMLANEFGAEGFALDISADSLRHGIALQEAWGLSRAPVRVAGDAVHLPFRDESLKLVCAFQMLSQFMDIEAVFLEVKRVLAPGGVFLFAEEPLKRLLSLRLYRCPYWDSMKPWERKLYQWGLLGYLVRDVIGAHQEESFGIRQNHTMGLKDWHRLIEKHFAAHEYEIFVPERGWGEQIVKRAASRLDPYRSHWGAARLLGGTLAAVCKKAGSPVAFPAMDRFESLLRCPDCAGRLSRDADDRLRCASCSYEAENQGGVYNLLPSSDRKELYPGDREDVIDFCLPSHAARLLEGWYDLEGVFGNKFRWIGPRASAKLVRAAAGPQRLRIRGHAHDKCFEQGQPVRISASANGKPAGQWTLDRPGLFILEADLPDAAEYRIDIAASPAWSVPTDDRVFTVNLSMLRLVPRG